MRLLMCRLFTAAVFAATPAFTFAAAPAPAAPAKNASPMDTARKALDEVGDLNYQGKTLNEVITDLKEKSKLDVVIDPMVYQFGLDPNMPGVNIALKQVKLKDGLRQALAPFNLKCGLTKDGLYISTEEGLTAKQLRQRVTVDCDGTSFAAAVKQLAADCGANIVIDPRLADKASKAVTLKLEDVPLETAIRLLAEVADFGAVRMSNVLFITSAERAEKLRPSADGPTQPGPSNPVFPFPPGGIDRPFPGGPPVIGLPGVVVPGGIGGGAVPVPEPAELPQVKPAVPPAPPAQQAPAVPQAPPGAGTTTPAAPPVAPPAPDRR